MPADLVVWTLFLAMGSLLTFVVLGVIFWWMWREGERWEGESPYTKLPLRPATSLSYFAAERALIFMDSFHDYENRIFKLSKAAFCRETGRIFPDCVRWTGRIEVGWDFIVKRYPGQYVSWGSLSPAQQLVVRKAHASLLGFQTEHSSPTSSPKAVEPEYAFTIPGPLYVDFASKVLVGWQSVPETNLEVLIVQKPIR